MTRIFDAPENFAATALQGFCAAHHRHVSPLPHGARRAAAAPGGKVALVVGGGSGHYPAFLGYIGPGFADAAVAGDVFASPSTSRITDVARNADHGGGVILGFGNYAGDVLNFGAAAERLRAMGIDTRILAVTDDVASAGADAVEKRRGIAGDLLVLKITGAAAEAGLDLDQVEAIGRKANAATVSFGLAFAGCSLPGHKAPLFTVEAGTIALGLGIHGEPGIRSTAMVPAAGLAEMLIAPLLAERPQGHKGRIAAVLNGLGSTKYEELFLLWHHITQHLEAAGLTLVAPEVGEFITSLDMAGCSLSLTWLDDALEPLWCAPADTPCLRRGEHSAAPDAGARALKSAGVAGIVAAGPEGQKAGICIAGLLGSLAGAMAEAEAELGRIDAQAGDGDHGQGMARGAQAAAEAAQAAIAAGAGPATVLSLAGDAWADRAGGTSGALWGVALRAWGQELQDDHAPTAEAVCAGASAALAAVIRLGGAEPGDKTLVDAFIPFAATLAAAIAARQPLSQAWADAAAAATAAAEATAALVPKKGRARPLAERSLGHCDAGAVSLALAARTIATALG